VHPLADTGPDEILVAEIEYDPTLAFAKWSAAMDIAPEA
jgi:hypothetical protein